MQHEREAERFEDSKINIKTSFQLAMERARSEFANSGINTNGWQYFNSWALNENRVENYGHIDYNVKI